MQHGAVTEQAIESGYRTAKQLLMAGLSRPEGKTTAEFPLTTQELRKMNGVSKSSFYQKYHEHIEDVFEIDELIKKGKLKENGDYLYIPNKYQYVANSILIYFIGE